LKKENQSLMDMREDFNRDRDHDGIFHHAAVQKDHVLISRYTISAGFRMFYSGENVVAPDSSDKR
jgi:hypothetical protein